MAEELRNKLYEYRIKKQKQKIFQVLKSKFREFWMLGIGQTTLNGKDHIINVNDTNVDVTKIQKLDLNAEVTKYVEDTLALSSVDEDDIVSGESYSSDLLTYALRAVIILLWITLYVIAIKLQFGMVYFMLSALFGIYYNTRTTRKKKNEISAYSVFNKNCESIDGSLKAEHFEKEIRYGSLR